MGLWSGTQNSLIAPALAALVASCARCSAMLRSPGGEVDPWSSAWEACSCLVAVLLAAVAKAAAATVVGPLATVVLPVAALLLVWALLLLLLWLLLSTTRGAAARVAAGCG